MFRALSAPKSSREAVLHSFPKHAVGAEIGVHRGDFSEKILAIAKPRKLFLIDPWTYEEGETYKDAWYGGRHGQNQSHMDDRYDFVLKRFSKNIEAGQVHVVRDTSERALQNMENESLDWVYIDGNHLYEFVRRDLELSLSKVRPGGIISGDDYTTGGWWMGGVKQAVDEFVRDKKIRDLKTMGSQFLLYKPEG